MGSVRLSGVFYLAWWDQQEPNAGLTNVQRNRSSTGGSNESVSDAANQAQEAKRQETPCENGQAGEEAEGAKREDRGCGASEKLPLAVIRRERFVLHAAFGIVSISSRMELR